MTTNRKKILIWITVGIFLIVVSFIGIFLSGIRSTSYENRMKVYRRYMEEISSNIKEIFVESVVESEDTVTIQKFITDDEAIKQIMYILANASLAKNNHAYAGTGIYNKYVMYDYNGEILAEFKGMSLYYKDMEFRVNVSNNSDFYKMLG